MYGSHIESSSIIKLVAESKKQFMKQFIYEGSQFKKGEFDSMDKAIDFTISEGGKKRPISMGDLMILQVEIQTNCLNPECVCRDHSSKEWREGNMALPQKLGVNNVQEGVDFIFDLERKKLPDCSVCAVSQSRVITNIRYPVLLHILFPTSFVGTVSTEINLFDKLYDLVTVAYGNKMHFKCRFKCRREDKVYEYDGMVNEGGCNLVTSTPSFPVMLKNMFRACGAWYIRVD
jgi:hypothetical protein